MVARELQLEFMVDDVKDVILSRVGNRLFYGGNGEGANDSFNNAGKRDIMTVQQMQHQLELAKVQAELQMSLAKEQTEQTRINLKLDSDLVSGKVFVGLVYELPLQGVE
ncbi:hypothetical protein Pcinc_016763 [Petrolisthes cinctipes]|uniref:Uncharacterized protein n=1 Tax=Petrolisthes cinctipes TaxID=88211 RepID=A0AAE1KPF6_PETCI|nr:hypothetical protein Pcinc_016763 [Petrolisthes cinctipes]